MVSIKPCPPIKAGPGRVVLATVTHYNSFLMDLRLAGVSEPLHLKDWSCLFVVSIMRTNRSASRAQTNAGATALGRSSVRAA